MQTMTASNAQCCAGSLASKPHSNFSHRQECAEYGTALAATRATIHSRMDAGMILATCSWRQHVWIIPALIGASVLAMPSSAQASPYCVQTQAIPAQCIFVDPASCNTRATQLGGTCTVNPSEIHVAPGLGHFCLLTAGQISSCVYADRADCDREAKHQQGVCIAAPGRPESPGPDPYRDIRPLMVGR
jgi:hypothetical protein